MDLLPIQKIQRITHRGWTLADDGDARRSPVGGPRWRKPSVVCAADPKRSAEHAGSGIQTVGWMALASVALALTPMSAEAGVKYEKKLVTKSAEETSASFPLLAAGASLVAGAPIAAQLAGRLLSRQAPEAKGTQKIRARANAPVSKPAPRAAAKTMVTPPKPLVVLPGTIKKSAGVAPAKPAPPAQVQKAQPAASAKGKNKFVDFFIAQAGVGAAVLAAIVVGTNLASNVSVPSVPVPPPAPKPEVPSKPKEQKPVAEKVVKVAPVVPAAPAPAPKAEAPPKSEKVAEVVVKKAEKVAEKPAEKKVEKVVEPPAPAAEKKAVVSVKKASKVVPAKTSSGKLTAEEAAARKATKKEANATKEPPTGALLALTLGVAGGYYYINKSAAMEGPVAPAATASSSTEIPGGDASIPVRVEDRKKWIAAWRKRTSA